MSLNRRNVLGGLLFLPVLAACSQEPEPSFPLDTFLTSNGYSGAVALSGRYDFRHGYGQADRDRQVANTPETLYCVASMGKMFTGVAVAQLVGQGKLAFTDPVERYVTGLPAGITLHHLLTHTSGLGDVLGRGPDSPSTLDDMVAAIRRERPQFAPGAGYAYSNSGFVVLGAVVEAVVGSYVDFVALNVFRAAGMGHTSIKTFRPVDVPGMAIGYPRAMAPNGDVPHVGNPSGGAISTVDDMLAFASALLDNRLLPAELTATVTTGKVATGRPGVADDKYGYGFSDRRVNGTRIVGHNGGSPGYEAQLDIYPDRGDAVVFLANVDDAVRPAVARSEQLLA